MNKTALQPKNSDEPPVPEYFYKYRSVSSAESIEHVRQIICDNYIYYPAPKSFNDPFDCRPAVSFKAPKQKIKNNYIDIAQRHGPKLNRADRRENAKQMFADPARDLRRPSAGLELQDALAAEVTEKVGVFCLSTVKDDILMWSHYSNCHTGICIEFDGYSALMVPAQKVKYALERPALNLYNDDDLTKLNKGLLTKSKHWQYEREWRLFRYEEGPGIQVFSPASITGVIFGANISTNAMTTIQGWLKERPTPVQTYKARVDNSKFMLHIDPLEK